jgi:DNA-binding transcriptional regulator YiaG
MNQRERADLVPLPCDCGGELRPVSLREYDASDELGIPLVLTGRIPALRCRKCGSSMVAGGLLDLAGREATLQVLKLPRLLSGREAAFLRKAALEVGQAELAARLGISRPTVARWEAERSLSSEHDFELRSLIVGVLLKRSRGAARRRRQELAALVELAAEILPAARSRPAPQRLPAIQIAG